MTPPSGPLRWSLPLVAAIVIAVGAFVVLNRGDSEALPAVPDTFAFPQQLSEYAMYAGDMADLTPGNGYHRFDLASSLFVDGSDKHRMLHIPEGTQIQPVDDDVPVFPEGSILVKTFFYPFDERDPSLGRRIIETRLLVLSDGVWNLATYVWNDAQDEATLEHDGLTVPVTWIDADGQEQSIRYEVPEQALCVTCHHRSGTTSTLGPAMRNLNLDVERQGAVVNQLGHFVDEGLMVDVDPATFAAGVDYLDSTISITDRGRTYLELNCAHCHRPDGWERPANQGLDFRIDTPLQSTGILNNEGDMVRRMRNGSMPFFGTTIVDEEGLAIIVEYLENN